MTQATSDFVILPQKPKFREPCNGCGECCRAGACEIAVQFLDEDSDRACRALEFDGEVYRCGLITNPPHYLGLPRYAQEGELRDYLSRSFAILIASGQGCGMED
jgi:hypothetical protein